MTHPRKLNKKSGDLYDRLAPDLDLTPGRAESLANYCDLQTKVWELSQKLDTEPFVLHTPQGQKLNPLVNALKNYSAEAAKQAKELGLTKAPEVDHADEFSDYLGD